MTDQGEGQPDRVRGRVLLVWPAVAVVLLLVVVGLATTGSAVNGHTRFALPSRSPSAAATCPPTDHSVSCRHYDVPAGQQQQHKLLRGPFYLTLTALIAVLAGLVVLMIVGLAVSLLQGGKGLATMRRRRPQVIERRVGEDPLGADARAERRLVEAIESGLARLGAEGDPRAAVIACWVGLEQAAAGAGVGRRDAETSAELTTRLLAQRAVDPDLLSRLGRLYRRARFSPATVDEQMRGQARSLLEQVQHQLLLGARTDA